MECKLNVSMCRIWTSSEVPTVEKIAVLFVKAAMIHQSPTDKTIQLKPLVKEIDWILQQWLKLHKKKPK